MASAPQERTPLEKRLKALILAGIDMSDVIEVATYLLGESEEATGHDTGMPWRVRRTLEAGLIVSYARAFTKSVGLATLGRPAGLSPERRETHDQLMDLRRTVYAHSDDTPFRQLRRPGDLDDVWPESLTEWLGEDGQIFEEEILEQWTPPTRKGLSAIRDLAEANRSDFAEQIDAIRSQLRGKIARLDQEP